MSTEQIIEKINSTLTNNKSIPEVIESLEIRSCNISHLTIYSLTSFLPNLKEISGSSNNIKKLSSQGIERDGPSGTYRYYDHFISLTYKTPVD